jgi:hypothetical protein
LRDWAGRGRATKDGPSVTQTVTRYKSRISGKYMRKGGDTMDRLGVVERGYKAAADGDRDALQQVFTEDAVWHLMEGTEIVQSFEGREAVVEYILRLRDLRLEAIMPFRDSVVAASSFASRSGGRAISTNLYEIPDRLVAITYCSNRAGKQ